MFRAKSLPSFKAIAENLKTFSKSIKKDENMGLKNKSLIGGWLLMAANIYRRQNLKCRFEDWLYEECRIKRQTSYNYRNIYKLMSVAPKLMNCRVNITFFFKTMKFFLNILLMNHKHPNISCKGSLSLC